MRKTSPLEAPMFSKPAEVSDILEPRRFVYSDLPDAMENVNIHSIPLPPPDKVPRPPPEPPAKKGPILRPVNKASAMLTQSYPWYCHPPVPEPRMGPPRPVTAEPVAIPAVHKKVKMKDLDQKQRLLHRVAGNVIVTAAHDVLDLPAVLRGILLNALEVSDAPGKELIVTSQEAVKALTGATAAVTIETQRLQETLQKHNESSAELRKSAEQVGRDLGILQDVRKFFLGGVPRGALDDLRRFVATAEVLKHPETLVLVKEIQCLRET